ncbi:MAG: flagellar basal body rod protein FlgC [Clostridiales bacterium]|jgi:flagellar basal-body rod protein FlgC|nr:flagellar basal body rod protein FlgC [Clostridiales bacterium]
MFKSMQISASGMTVQRLRMDVIAQNVANMNTTRTADGGPYRRRLVNVQEDTNSNVPFSQYLDRSRNAFSGKGVKATAIVEDPTPFKRIHDPGHPDADEDGYVLMPNVDSLKEMVDMISATRSYEANVTAFNAAKSMAIKGLEIGRR